jgi:ectoine hydroxylase-related dioxygenase (phytanoyl-CoA dioxygenase family)
MLPVSSTDSSSKAQRAAWRRQIEEGGSFIERDVLSASHIAQLKRDLIAAIDAEAVYHGGSDYSDYGMVLGCYMYGRAFLELLDHAPLIDPIEAALGPSCIVYAYTSSSMPPHGSNYSGRIHVDSPRVIPGYPTNLGVTIALDDFTAENGATYYLPGSHTRLDAPSEEEFLSGAERLIVPAGSAWFFNARTWHRGGQNMTTEWRHGLTFNICRPYMKQRLDIPRMLAGRDLSGLPERVIQKLGFLSQVPASLDEYYASPEQRKCRQSME